MRWINALERRFGHLAIPGLMRVVVAFNVLVWLLMKTKPGFASALELQPDLVYRGQVWRLFTYAFIPPIAIGAQLEFLWLFAYLNFLWLLGEGIEQAWGSFRLNAYYLLGMLGTTVAVFCFGIRDVTGFYLNSSLLFAFATLLPDYPIMVMLFLPVRMKWIALFSLGLVLLRMAGGTLTDQVAIAISLGNYLVFFGPFWIQRVRERGKVAVRQQQFQIARQVGEDETLHHCKVCGRNEVNSPDLEFRVASDGEEYCLTHLPSRRPEMQMPPPLPG